MTFGPLQIFGFRPQFAASTLVSYHPDRWIGVPPGATIPPSVPGSGTFRIYQGDTLVSTAATPAFAALPGNAGVTVQRPPLPPGMYRLEFQATLVSQEIDGIQFVPNPVPTLTLDFEVPAGP
ncbi:hypothetical protein [Agromyces tropicus]|uniref:hypothetical protein n=1 Tax=Agromyces tropicus TaxID=555371 RepID=UPI0031D6735A